MSEDSGTNRNLVLKASAGTGKTFAIATRYLRLLIFENVDPATILALTFSRAAAQEIYAKILERLWTASGANVSPTKEIDVGGEKRKVAKTDSEVQVLVYSPGMDSAHTILITFFDGSSVEASIQSQDRVSGLAVLSANIDSMDSSSKDLLQVAELGSSAASTLVGQTVIAVGRPIGTSGSISYGAVTSASTNLGVPDSGFMQITTDIIGSKQASGVLINPDGRVVGIIDTRHGRSDLPGVLCAIGITETKQLIEKLSAGGKKAYLGVQCTDVPEDVRQRMDMPEGVYLTEVAEGSPAMNAGLQKGDIIISMNGEDVHYSATLSRILLEEEAGTEIEIALMRPSGEDYTEMELTVVLE